MILSAYGFDYNSPKLINIFVSGRKLRTKKGSFYSPNLDLFMSVPQGLIFLFYIHIHV